MSSDPNVWGPPLWDFLFSIVFNSNGCTEKDFSLLFSTLENVIPCPGCRKDYNTHRKMLKENKVEICAKNPSKTAAIWLWTMHDVINQKLGKICISYDKLKERHGTFTSLTNEFVVVELFYLMSNVVKERRVIEFIMACTPLFKNSYLFRLPELLPVLKEDTLREDLFKTYINLCMAFSISNPPTQRQFQERFKFEHPEPVEEISEGGGVSKKPAMWDLKREEVNPRPHEKKGVDIKHRKKRGVRRKVSPPQFLSYQFS